MTLAIKRSRASQAQKDSRRPALEMRQPSSQRSRHPKKSTFSLATKYIDDSTLRRLTSGMWAVRKEAFLGAKQDGNRLLKQIEKQILFSSRCRTSKLYTISTPEIYGISIPRPQTSDRSFAVDMEYIPFHDVRHIMLEKDRATNEWLIDTAIDLVDDNLSSSTLGRTWPTAAGV